MHISVQRIPFGGCSPVFLSHSLLPCMFRFVHIRFSRISAAFLSVVSGFFLERNMMTRCPGAEVISTEPVFTPTVALYFVFRGSSL